MMIRRCIFVLVALFLVSCAADQTTTTTTTATTASGDLYSKWTAVPNTNFSTVSYRVHCSYYGSGITGSYWEVQMKNNSTILYIKADAQIGIPVYNGSLLSSGLYQINPNGGSRAYIGNASVSSIVDGVSNCQVGYTALVGVWAASSTGTVATGANTASFTLSNTTDALTLTTASIAAPQGMAKSVTGPQIQGNLSDYELEQVRRSEERYQQNQQKKR